MNDDDHFESLRRQIRVLAILQGAEEAGLAPLPVTRLHNVAFLANVLAPVSQTRVMDGRVLKRQGGPFYPALQQDIDRLVGLGVVIIHGVQHCPDESGRWRLEGSYGLNPAFAAPILIARDAFTEERIEARYIREIAFAVSGLSDADLDHFVEEDAAYSDALVDIGNVVDFAEWRMVNYSANAANAAGRLMLGGTRATAGEKIHIYVRHLQARLHRVG
jgi:hypothetical protein